MGGIDLAIGTRFNVDGKLVEVVEGSCKCTSCVFYKQIFEGADYDEYLDCCYAISCGFDGRKDKKEVYFKEVKE